MHQSLELGQTLDLNRLGEGCAALFRAWNAAKVWTRVTSVKDACQPPALFVSHAPGPISDEGNNVRIFSFWSNSCLTFAVHGQPGVTPGSLDAVTHICLQNANSRGKEIDLCTEIIDPPLEPLFAKSGLQ